MRYFISATRLSLLPFSLRVQLLEHIPVENGLQEFLASGGELDLLIRHGVFAQLLEAHLALVDLLTDAAGVALVALGDEVLPLPRLQPAVRDEQTVGKGIHAGDIPVDRVDGREGTPAHLGVEAQSAGGQAGVEED